MEDYRSAQINSLLAATYILEIQFRSELVNFSNVPDCITQWRNCDDIKINLLEKVATEQKGFWKTKVWFEIQD